MFNKFVASLVAFGCVSFYEATSADLVRGGAVGDDPTAKQLGGELVPLGAEATIDESEDQGHRWPTKWTDRKPTRIVLRTFTIATIEQQLAPDALVPIEQPLAPDALAPRVQQLAPDAPAPRVQQLAPDAPARQVREPQIWYPPSKWNDLLQDLNKPGDLTCLDLQTDYSRLSPASVKNIVVKGDAFFALQGLVEHNLAQYVERLFFAPSPGLSDENFLHFPNFKNLVYLRLPTIWPYKHCVTLVHLPSSLQGLDFPRSWHPGGNLWQIAHLKKLEALSLAWGVLFTSDIVVLRDLPSLRLLDLTRTVVVGGLPCFDEFTQQTSTAEPTGGRVSFRRVLDAHAPSADDWQAALPGKRLFFDRKFNDTLRDVPGVGSVRPRWL